MRISELKALTDNRKIRLAFSDFWEIQYFCDFLSNYHGECELNALYSALREEALKRFQDKSLSKQERKKTGKAMKGLCIGLFDDKDYWIHGTSIETRRKEIASRPERQQKAHDELCFMYERFDLKELRKGQDMTWLLVFAPNLCEVVLNKESAGQLNTWRDLYDCCMPIAIALLKNSAIKYPEYWIMYTISKRAFDNPYYWLESNGFKQEDALTWQKKDNKV